MSQFIWSGGVRRVSLHSHSGMSLATCDTEELLGAESKPPDSSQHKALTLMSESLQISPIRKHLEL